jgi:multiple sugar transport system substrate-binding protein
LGIVRFGPKRDGAAAGRRERRLDSPFLEHCNQYRRMQMKRVVVLFLALLIVAPWVAASGDPDATVMASGGVRFFHYLRGLERDIMTEMIKRFETANPGTKVQFEFVPETDHMVKMQTMIAANDIPDVIGLKDVMLVDFVRFGVLQPLDPYLKAKGATIDMTDWVPGLAESLSYKGQVFGVPEQWSPNVLYVHEGLFKQAGVAIPGKDNKWEDMLVWGKKLIKDTDGDGKTDNFGIGGLSGRVDTLAGQIWAFGGTVFDPRTMKYKLDSPEAIRAYKLSVALVDSGITPRPDQRQGINHWEIQRMAMVWDNRYIMPSFQTYAWAKDFMRVAYHPIGSSDRNRSSMRILTLPKKAPNTRGGAKLMEYLTSKEGVVNYTKLGRVSPWYKSIALDAAEHQKLINPWENAEAYIDAIQDWKGPFYGVQWERVRKLTEDAMNAMIRHVVTVEEGARKLNADMNALYDELPPNERIWAGVP